MKKLILLISLIVSVNSFSQEVYLPTHTQYLADNYFVIAPTYAGIGENMKIRLNALTQWVGIKDAPDTQSLVGDIRIGNKSGVGLLFYNDRNGNTRQQGARASFAHHLTLSESNDQFLSFGISYVYNHFRIDIENFDPTIPDPAIVDDRALGNHNFEVGVLYRYKSFYLNLTAANILDKDLENFTIYEPGKLRNYTLFSGYRIKTKNKDVEVEPSVYFQLYESDGRSVTDLNVKVRKNFRDDNYAWAGISYRFLNDQFMAPLNIGPMAGIMMRKLYFAYSYQIIMNDLINYNSGTHMITVGIDIFRGTGSCECMKLK